MRRVAVLMIVLWLGLGPIFSLTAGAQEVLPFPPTPSASTAELSMKDSVYKKRVTPSRLQPGAPNVLIILIDDVGPGVASTYGGEVETPTLSRIADAGISYNRFHSTAMCSPTRAALLTDQYCSRYAAGARGKGEPSTGTQHVGFRLVMSIEPPAVAAR